MDKIVILVFSVDTFIEYQINPYFEILICNGNIKFKINSTSLNTRSINFNKLRIR